jgi:hypothetical protein
MQTLPHMTDADRKRRIRRNAILLALLALGFYAAFIVVTVTKA